jgi:starch phosphorylase
MVQSILALKNQPMAGDRTVFLEDYDLAMAQEVVAGCDVWLNLPRAPLEASGTSGMKAALNGGLNLSVLDGWWCEGYDGKNGWAIEAPPSPDGAIQDARDADELYRLLEREIVPAFYERDEGGVPRRWLRLVKASLRSLAPAFVSTRMLNDYAATVYGRPAGELPPR